MKVPFADLSLQHKPLKAKMLRAVGQVIDRGDFILGEDVARFEKEFARLCRTRYAVGVNSGTDALFLALKAAGVGPGDEVVVPAFTYIATALAVSYTGAVPVFADIDERTYNIDLQGIVRAISPRTKAIIPVHLYGQPAPMEKIMDIARAGGIKVIEDAAQAHGAALKGAGGQWRACGSLGDMGCFSFYPSKNLGALGDGGMVTTDDDELYKKLLMLRDYGRVSKYEHAIIGYNARLDTVQAALLRVKLPHLKAWNAERQKAASLYTKLLKDIEGLTVPYTQENARHVYHVYAVRLRNRQRVVTALAANGISAIIHYPIPVHLQEAYKELRYAQGDFPVSERVSSEILSLPMYPGMKDSRIRFVVKVIKKVV